MGSGISGLYVGTYGTRQGKIEIEVGGDQNNFFPTTDERKSQPYAESYSVTKEMLEYDKNRGVYTKDGYKLNPTATKAMSNLKGGILVNRDGSLMEGNYTYAVTINGDLIIGKRNGNGRDGIPTPHPTLIGGKNPRVKVAGIVSISRGKIVKYDNESGHFKLNILSMPAADEAFLKLPSSAFHRNFKKNMDRS